MKGFPPPAEEQVTLANWRQSPFNRWGFQHVGELIPVATAAAGRESHWHLREDPSDILDVEVKPADGKALTVEAALQSLSTDGFMVLRRGDIIAEHYRNGLGPDGAHILFSVTKSITAILGGILTARDVLDPNAPITDYVPEAAQTAYAGASVRHLLDMRTGIAFDEDYLATEGPIVQYREATGWNPPSPEGVAGLRQFLLTLTETQMPHGGPFRYLSPNSDVLGWVLERASGKRYADMLSELLWQPMGAEGDAYITVDAYGAPRTAGGLCMSLRDLARVGQLLLQDGKRDDTEIIPPDWIADMRRNGDKSAWADGDFAETMPSGMSYRSQWYILDGDEAPYYGIGIHGQYLFVDPAREVVIAMFSSRGQPLDPDEDALSLQVLQAVAARIAG
jgi:hypothetical protein